MSKFFYLSPPARISQARVPEIFEVTRKRPIFFGYPVTRARLRCRATGKSSEVFFLSIRLTIAMGGSFQTLDSPVCGMPKTMDNKFTDNYIFLTPLTLFRVSRTPDPSEATNRSRFVSYIRLIQPQDKGTGFCRKFYFRCHGGHPSGNTASCCVVDFGRNSKNNMTEKSSASGLVP